MKAEDWADVIEIVSGEDPRRVPGTDAQRTMMAIALCNPAWLPERLAERDIRECWRLLDEAQVHGILIWMRQQSIG